jgi:DNA-binding transcriptional regulator GbsR (MarR family)
MKPGKNGPRRASDKAVRQGTAGLRGSEDPAIERFIEDIGRFYEENGIPRIGARIMALLIVSEEPLSAERIADRLKVARSSISANMKLILAKGSAEPVTYGGDRLTYYRFSWDTWQQVLRTQMNSFGRVKEITHRALLEIPADYPTRGRIEEYETWVDFFVSQYKGILENWPKKEHRDG